MSSRGCWNSTITRGLNPVTFQLLLAGADPEGFLSRDWGTNLRIFHDVDIGIRLDWDSAIAFIEDGNLSYPDLKVLDEHGEVHPREYVPTGVDVFSSRVSAAHVKRLLFKGKTVRLSRIQRFREDARVFLRALTDEIPGEIGINAYMSYGETVGLKAHYDPQHTFAVHLEGEKEWHFGGVVCENPTPNMRPLAADAVAETRVCVARSGDALYFPPGMWHYTRTRSRSLHVTVGMHLPTWGQLLHAMVDKAADADPLLRSTQRMQFVQGKLRPTPCAAEDLAVLCERVVAAYRLRGADCGEGGWESSR